MTVRLAVAGTPVIAESAAGDILAGEIGGLAERERVAIAFADELMTQPGQMSDRLVAELHRVFSDDELAELTVKILKFNMQKVTVACGHDMTMTVDSLNAHGWGADGSFVAAG